MSTSIQFLWKNINIQINRVHVILSMNDNIRFMKKKESKSHLLKNWIQYEELRIDPFVLTISLINWDVLVWTNKLNTLRSLTCLERTNVLGKNQWNLEECLKPNFFSYWNLVLTSPSVKRMWKGLFNADYTLIG